MKTFCSKRMESYPQLPSKEILYISLFFMQGIIFSTKHGNLFNQRLLFVYFVLPCLSVGALSSLLWCLSKHLTKFLLLMLIVQISLIIFLNCSNFEKLSGTFVLMIFIQLLMSTTVYLLTLTRGS